MATEHRNTPTGTQTIKTGFGLRLRKTGEFLRVDVQDPDDGPDEAVLTTDDTHPLYLADTADAVAEVLVFGEKRRGGGSEHRPALGRFTPEDLEAVWIRQVITTETETTPVEVPKIFNISTTEYCLDVKEKQVEEFLGCIPELPDGCTRFVAHFVRSTEDVSVEKCRANLGRKVYFGEDHYRVLLGVTDDVPTKWAVALKTNHSRFVIVCGS